MTTEQTLIDLYENAFGDEVDKTSDTWKTFQCILTLRPAFYKLMMSNERVLFYPIREKAEVIEHVAWIFWEGKRPDDSPLGKTDWEKIGNMFVQMKKLEETHYG